MGQTTFQILAEMAEYSGGTVPDNAPPEELQAAAARFSMTKASKFVAACIDVPVCNLGEKVTLSRFREVWASCCPPS